MCAIVLHSFSHSQDEVTESHEEICAHQFVRQPPQSRVLLGMMCEGCGKRVTGLIRTWYLCKGEIAVEPNSEQVMTRCVRLPSIYKAYHFIAVCHSPCHKSCLAGVSRMCIGSKVKTHFLG